jgi:hypothetical protein
MPLFYGQPTPGAGAWAVSTCPVRGSPVGFSGRHSAAIMNNVLPSGPPRPTSVTTANSARLSLNSSLRRSGAGAGTRGC